MNKWRFMERMEKANYTQATLSKELGMAKNTLNNKLNGRGCFNTVEIEAVCKKLNITDNLEKAEIFLNQPSQN